MKKTAKVFLRQEGSFRHVKITNSQKPEISATIMQKWQHIINLIAKILDVPASLIMQITEESMRVFLKSQNPRNPYQDNSSDYLGHGLYCESVIGLNRELLIDNALNYESWRDNPDVKLNMISYYGLPIQWPDKEFFGTICVLDDHTNNYNETYRELMQEFKLTIERDLELLCYQSQLKQYAEMDILTSVYNRRKLESILSAEFEKQQKSSSPSAVAIMDINNFKGINDKYGHKKGDEMLQAFAQAIKAQIQDSDAFGRWGGDEFLLICPHTNIQGINAQMERIKNAIRQETEKIVPGTTFCYGSSQFFAQDRSYQEIVNRADRLMYHCKNKLSSLAN